MQTALSLRRLACRRGARLLFRGLDLELRAGQAVWVRGRNGRGKTSLLRLAAGLSQPEHGDVARDREVVFIGHATALKDDLSAREALRFLLRLHGRSADADDALDRMGLQERRDAMVRTLSQGQRRRVALARLAAERGPLLWVLDEPYDALDDDGSARLDALLAAHTARGGSVLLASHVAPGPSLNAVELDLDRHAAA